MEITPDLSAKKSLLQVNPENFDKVCEELRTLAKRQGLENTLSMSDIMRFQSLFEKSSDEAPQTEEIEAQFTEVLKRALSAFILRRKQEGETIADDFAKRLQSYIDNLNEAESMRPSWLTAYRERTFERVTEIAEATHIQIDKTRLEQEIILFVERSDIEEELQRAKAHHERLCALINKALSSDEDKKSEPRGKTIDFYLQEMMRETNTMASKSNLADLTAIVVKMKSCVEQMREQAANVE